MLGKRGMGEVAFMFIFITFTISLVFLTSEYVRTQTIETNTTLWIEGNYTNQTYSQLTSEELRNFTEPPVCNLDGWGLVTSIFGVTCVVDYGVWFLGMAFISTTFLILNLVLIGMGIVFVYIIIRLLRGGG